LVASVASGGDLDAPTVGTIGETEHLAEESQRGVDILIAALHRTSLQEVEDALARFERGEFGRCVACGCDIPIERLEAMPAAANCVHCQGALERSH
jgi:RNA polymerase-binding transcription factor DksA